MEKESKRHIQLPSDDGINDLTPQDQLVYLGIKSFMNKDSRKAFPSQKIVAQKIGCCDKTVRKSIKNLVDKGYIKVEKKGRLQIYTFNEVKQFEPFSYEFLDNQDLNFSEKALLASTQKYMYDKESGVGKISFSKMELAERINMPYSTLARITRGLQNKDIITLKKLSSKDSLTGCNKQEMQFDFNKYGQTIVKVLLNHEDRILNVEESLLNTSYEISNIHEEIENLKNQLKETEIYKQAYLQLKENLKKDE